MLLPAMDRVIDAAMIQIQDEPSRASPLKTEVPPLRVSPRKTESTRRTHKEKKNMKKEIQESTLSQVQLLTLELSPPEARKPRGGRKPSSFRSLESGFSPRNPSSFRLLESGFSPSTAPSSRTPRKSKLSLDQMVEEIYPAPPIQQEEEVDTRPRRKSAPARASSDSVTSSRRESGCSSSTAGSKSSELAASKPERRRARSSSRSRNPKRKGKKEPPPTPKSSEELLKGDAPPTPPRKAPESPTSTHLQHTPRPDVMQQPSMPRRSVSLVIVSKSTMSRQLNRPPPPRQLNGVMVPGRAGASPRPSMGRKSLSQRFMRSVSSRSINSSVSSRSINSKSSPPQQPEDASPPQPGEDQEKKIVKCSNGKGLETPKRSKRILNGLRRSFSFIKKEPIRSKSDSKKQGSMITPRRGDLSSFLNSPEKQRQPSTENKTVSTMSITEHSFSARIYVIDSPLVPPQQKSSSPTKPTRRNSFFNLEHPPVEELGGGLGLVVEGAEGLLPIVDPQWRMAEVVKGSSGTRSRGSPPTSLGGHLEQMEQENEQAEKDIEEASDIISLPMDNVPATRKVSRSKSFSKKQSKKPRSMRRLRSSPNSRGQSVSFHTVIIREYGRCVGDNPAVSSGPPISLGWDYLPNREVSVDHYESNIRPLGPRTRKDFFLPPQKRFHILLDEWGFCVQEICRAKDEAAKINYQRHQSCFDQDPVPTGSPSTSTSTKSCSLIKKKKGHRSITASSGGSGNSSKPARNTIPPPPPPSPTQAQDRWNTSCPASPHAVTAA
jgi:hypothetical protein